jgi:SAM-dependent methyltransferase
MRDIDPSTARVLDLGAGPTPVPERRLKGKVRRVVGVDIDPVVLTNQAVDEAHVFDGATLPFSAASFDAVLSDWTIEHLREPLVTLKEIHRVLKPGASWWFRTTNSRHYVTMVSAYTPHWFHRLLANRARGLQPGDHDPWPAHYRMNSPAALRRGLAFAGFTTSELRLMEPDPSYMCFNPLAFRLGVAYERIVNSRESLAQFRLVISGKATK